MHLIGKSMVVLGLLATIAIQAGEMPKLLNGTFRDGLTKWTATGDVSEFSGQALLGDLTANVSTLHQEIRPVGDEIRVDFHFLPVLSPNRPLGTLLDTISVTLYYVDDPAAFDFSSGSFHAATKLFDLDANGPTNAAGTFAESEFNASMTAFTATVPIATNGCVILAFELYNLNGVVGDSRLFLDWVNISESEPVCSGFDLRVAEDNVILTVAPLQGYTRMIETTLTVEDENSWQDSGLDFFDLETFREAADPQMKFYRVRFRPRD